MKRSEVLLKVILSPQETLVDTYKALVAQGNSEDFQKILELKGLRSEKGLLEQYNDIKARLTLARRETAPALAGPGQAAPGQPQAGIGREMKRMLTGMGDVFTFKRDPKQ